jgi:hypothetical protein
MEPGPETAARMEKVLADFWKDLEGRVETLLRAHCGTLIALADSLLKRSSLSQKEVLAILQPAPAAAAVSGDDGAAAEGTQEEGASSNGHAPSCSELELVASA